MCQLSGDGSVVDRKCGHVSSHAHTQDRTRASYSPASRSFGLLPRRLRRLRCLRPLSLLSPSIAPPVITIPVSKVSAPKLLTLHILPAFFSQKSVVVLASLVIGL